MRLEEFINSSIDKLIEKDRYLLDKDVNERSITHKLAEHMQNIIGEKLNVDCEYNRNINEEDLIKKLHLSNNKDVKKVYPDIIVHKRDKKDCNKIVIEVKKEEGDNKEFDNDKLELYTSPKELNYSYGVYIEFFTKNRFINNSISLDDSRKSYIKEIIYYKEGKKNNECKDETIF